MERDCLLVVRIPMPGYWWVQFENSCEGPAAAECSKCLALGVGRIRDDNAMAVLCAPSYTRTRECEAATHQGQEYTSGTYQQILGTDATQNLHQIRARKRTSLMQTRIFASEMCSSLG